MAGSPGVQADWYPREKVKFAKLKLLGAHSRYITGEELKLNPSIKKQLGSGLRHVLPNSSVNAELRLSVEAQVRALIEHASDSNLTGRIYAGWEPWV